MKKVFFGVSIESLLTELESLVNDFDVRNLDRIRALVVSVKEAITASLSAREKEITELIVEGKSNAEIADALCICEKTVKFHITNIFKKMKVRNRTGLTAEYYKAKIEEMIKVQGDEQKKLRDQAQYLPNGFKS